MRILATDQFGELGGAQHGFLEAIAGFRDRGWEVHAAVPTGPLIDKLEPLCASVQLIPCGPYRSVSKGPVDAVRFGWQGRQQAHIFRAEIARSGIDAIYVNGPRVLPAAALAARGCPVIFHSHSVVTQRSVVRLISWALRRSSATVLASSHFVTEWLRPVVNSEPRVIYNGIAGWGLDAPRPKSNFTRIGVLGRIAPEKGQSTFAQAARIATQHREDLTFFVGGAPMFADPGYLEQVRREAPAGTKFLGWMAPARFFEQIDVLVVPSAGIDANPRVIPEAFAAGVPVIAFHSGGVSELLQHDENGILVREHSPEALAEAILQATAQSAVLNLLAANGYRSWQQRFTLARFQSEVCEAVERAARPEPRTIRINATA